ncbi:MAG: hypothetical protein J6Y70_00970 [Bacilli bacterium]|nr:hypothetical protein [Bacilli bacterium]
MLENIIDKIIPNIPAFILQFIAFVILCLIVMIFVYKPIKKILQKRNEFVEHCIKNNIENEKKSGQILQNLEKKISSVNAETLEIIKNAQKESKKKSEIMIQETEMLCKEKLQLFEKELNNKLKDKNDEIRKLIINTASEMCKKILTNEISKEDDQKRFNDLVNKLQKINDEQKNNI